MRSRIRRSSSHTEHITLFWWINIPVRDSFLWNLNFRGKTKRYRRWARALSHTFCNSTYNDNSIFINLFFCFFVVFFTFNDLFFNVMALLFFEQLIYVRLIPDKKLLFLVWWKELNSNEPEWYYMLLAKQRKSIWNWVDFWTLYSSTIESQKQKVREQDNLNCREERNNVITADSYKKLRSTHWAGGWYYFFLYLPKKLDVRQRLIII